MDLQIILEGIISILTSEEVLTFVATTLISIMGFIATQVRPILLAWFEAKKLQVETNLTEQQLAVLEYFAQLVVKEAEQIKWEDKKKEAMKRLSAYLADRGLEFSEEEISSAIEAQVHELNQSSVVGLAPFEEIVSE